MNERPRVLLIALGGTISAAPDEVGRSFPARVATDLLSSVPDAAAIADVTAADVKQVPSRAVTPADICALAHEVRNGVAEGYDGARYRRKGASPRLLCPARLPWHARQTR